MPKFATLLLLCTTLFAQQKGTLTDAELMTEFELSAKSIFYEHSYYSSNGGKEVSSILVTKTATGAIATVKEKSNRKNIVLNLNLNREEWLGFIRILSKLRVYEWEEKYYPYEPKDHIDSLLTRKARSYAGDWTVKIIYSDTFKSSGRDNAHPSNFSKFQDAMNSMKEKVEETPIENKLKTKYEKRFGIPISNLELSTKKVRFSIGQYSNYDIFYADRTATGGFVTYRSDKYRNYTVELNMEEWLDFIRALYNKCRVNEWDRDHYIL